VASAVALAFDASKVDNPELARLILEKTCRRMVVGQAGSHEAMIQHFEQFGRLGCLSPQQVHEFSERIRKLPWIRDCSPMREQQAGRERFSGY
jgi:hypothetical protein